MKTPNFFSSKAMILALGLVLTILTISWLFSGSQTSAQSDGSQPLSALAATGTGFTYQGHLNLSGAPTNESFTFQFVLYDSATGGAQIGGAQTKAITVNNGLFTTTLNEAGEFGATAFDGEARYLEIRVSDNGGTSYTTLTPRQSLTAAPYAHSLRPGAVISSALDNAAILSLANNGVNSLGLYVDSATIGVRVLSGINQGVLVDSATEGVRVVSAAGSGMQVDSAADGFRVLSAVNGVNVDTATDNGAYVGSAAGSGLFVNSADFGARVTNARIGYFAETATQTGVQINQANDGIYVLAASNNGVRIDNSGNKGMQIGTAGTDGVYVGSAGNPIITISSTENNGFEVAGTEGDGLFVGNAFHGVRVNSASEGMLVDSTTSNGIRIVSAGFDGTAVYSAVNDGLYVGAAGNDGVDVASALTTGIRVRSAPNGAGLYVMSANTGLNVKGTGGVAGVFDGQIQVTNGSCVGCLLATFGVNASTQSLQIGDVVSLQGIQPSGVDAVPMLMEVGPTLIGASVVGVVVGNAEMVSVAEPRPGESEVRLVAREAASVAPGEYVTIVYSGMVQVKASALSNNIQTGDRLAVDANGAARSQSPKYPPGVIWPIRTPIFT